MRTRTAISTLAFLAVVFAAAPAIPASLNIGGAVGVSLGSDSNSTDSQADASASVDASADVGSGKSGADAGADADADLDLWLLLMRQGLLNSGDAEIDAALTTEDFGAASLNLGLGVGAGDADADLAHGLGLGADGGGGDGASFGMGGDGFGMGGDGNGIDLGFGPDGAPPPAGGGGVPVGGRAGGGAVASIGDDLNGADVCAELDDRRFLEIIANADYSANAIGAWSRASNVQVIPMRVCPAVKARISAAVAASPGIDLLRRAVLLDALISASLSRTRFDAEDVIAVERSGSSLSVYVY